MTTIGFIYFATALTMFLCLSFSRGSFESRAEIYRQLGFSPWLRLAWFAICGIACFFWPATVLAWLMSETEE